LILATNEAAMLLFMSGAGKGFAVPETLQGTF
jgi:hypothetical protein